MAKYVFGVYGAISSPPAGDSLLGTFAVQETSGTDTLASGSYVSGFFGFPKGAIPSGSKPEIRKADGTTVLAVQQFDATVTADDGSLIAGAFTYKTEDALTAGSEASYTIYSTTGALSSTSLITTAGLTADHSFKVEAVDAADSITYTASLADYINGSNSRVTASGAVCKEWTVDGVLKNGATEHSTLWARFYMRLHEDGSTICSTAKLFNGYVENGAAVSLTSCAFKDDTTAIDSYSTVTLPPNSCVKFGKSGAPWTRNWSANEPAFFIKYDMTDLQNGNLQWKLLNTSDVLTAIGAAPSPVVYDPDDPSKFFGADTQDGTGAHDWLGTIMRADACTLVTQDKGWHNYALSKHIYSHLAPVHYYERTGFYLPVANNLHANYNMGPDRKTVGFGAAPTNTRTGLPSKFSSNSSHYPGWGYYPYFTTGLREWLDEMQAHVPSIILNMNPGTSNNSLANSYARNGARNSTTYYGALPAAWSNNLRAIAWAFKMADNAAYLTPDDDVAKDYLNDIINISGWDAMADQVAMNISDDANRATLGLFRYSYGASTGSTAEAPWMSDYFGLVTAMAIKRGRIDTSHAWVTHHIVKFEMGRFNNACPATAACYNLALEQGGTIDGSNPLVTDWADVKAGDITNLPAMVDYIPAGGCPTSGFQAPSDAYAGGHRYPCIAHAAAGALKSVGLTEADAVVAYMEANDSTATASNWASGLQWGIRP